MQQRERERDGRDRGEEVEMLRAEEKKEGEREGGGRDRGGERERCQKVSLTDDHNNPVPVP